MIYAVLLSLTLRYILLRLEKKSTKILEKLHSNTTYTYDLKNLRISD